MNWEVIIGLETHAQLQTKSKIFSGSSIAFGAEPNMQANAVDIALPGVLPVLNREAVVCAIKFGLAVGCFLRIAGRALHAGEIHERPVKESVVIGGHAAGSHRVVIPMRRGH